MNAQQAFDTSTRAIIAQGGPAWGKMSPSDADSCLYRAHMPNGETRKCAFGALVPDERYNSDMEGRSANRAIVWLGERGASLGLEDLPVGFLNYLQQAHDDAAKMATEARDRDGNAFWNEWKARLHTLASNFLLDGRVLYEVPYKAT